MGLLVALPGLTYFRGVHPNSLSEEAAMIDASPWVEHNSIAARFDTGVRFWGRVVDQNGDPVKDAEIAASVTTLRLVKVNGRYQEYSMLTARSTADGSFKLEGAEGFSLTIEQIHKVSYVLPSAYQAGTRWPGAKYDYRYLSMDGQGKIFTPDMSKPEVFHL